MAEKQEIFSIFHRSYPGTKRGCEVEWQNFVKKYPRNYTEILPLLMPALTNQIQWRVQQKARGGFVPVWKNLQTWLNQQCWTEIHIIESAVKMGGSPKIFSMEEQQAITDKEFEEYLSENPNIKSEINKLIIHLKNGCNYD